jgi:hypothetical protein
VWYISGILFASETCRYFQNCATKGAFMTLNSTNKYSSQTLRNSEQNTYTYKGSKVKIITVFDNAIALVEDENGEVFEVKKGALR